MLVDSLHQLDDGVLANFVITAFECGQSRTLYDRNVVAVEVVVAQQFANFQFDQLEQFFVVYLVNLVQVNDQSRNANLTR